MIGLFVYQYQYTSFYSTHYFDAYSKGVNKLVINAEQVHDENYDHINEWRHGHKHRKSAAFKRTLCFPDCGADKTQDWAELKVQRKETWCISQAATPGFLKLNLSLNSYLMRLSIQIYYIYTLIYILI